jgi:Sulfatase
VKARQQYEVALAKSIHAAIDDERLERWGKALVTPCESGVTVQSWLWAPPAKHSTRQIEELLKRIGTLYELGIHRHFAEVPDDLLRRYVGEHGLSVERRLPYEESVRAPLLVRYPPTVREATTVDALVSSIDIAPTILNSAGPKSGTIFRAYRFYRC